MIRFPVPPASEITPQALYAQRRRFLQVGAALVAGSVLPTRAADTRNGGLGALVRSPLSTVEEPTPLRHVTSYNNYYEFGYGKSDPEEHAHRLRTRPWTIRIDGLVKTPVTLDIERILKLASLEERIYRLRCVEGWSMVVPWVGYSLSTLLKQVEPLGSARFIEVETVLQSDVMHGTRYRVLDWPYIEGLRLDEAMHPLTLLAVGLYGDVLPNQNGAPARLVVPWKYGFKSGKSITRIRFVERQPETTWIKSSPTEYGFYANVNPAVDHPRWSQARERRIGDFFKRETLPFNGYAEQVASLYAGMDLRRNF